MEALTEIQPEQAGLERDLLMEIEAFRRAIGSRGERIKSYTPSALMQFRQKPKAAQAAIFAGFQSYSSLICSAVMEDRDAILDERRLLKNVASRLRLVISDEIYETMEKDTIIEIYNQDFLQIYRSLRFVDLCNYSLLDLLTYEYYELYERSASVNEHLFEACGILRQTKEARSISLAQKIPRHLLRERFSEKRGVFTIDFQSIHSVHGWPNGFYGFLTMMKATENPVATEVQNFSFL